MITASLSGLEDDTGCGVNSSALCIVGIMCLFLAPLLLDHMLQLPQSPRPPRGSRLESPCQVSGQDLQLQKPLVLITRRSAVHSKELAHTGVNTAVCVYMHTQHALHLQQDLPISGARAFNYGDVNKHAALLVSKLSLGAFFFTRSYTQICLRGCTLH